MLIEISLFVFFFNSIVMLLWLSKGKSNCLMISKEIITKYKIISNFFTLTSNYYFVTGYELAFSIKEYQ